MNPDTGAMYADMDEAVKAGEDPDNIVLLQGRRDKINKIISDLQSVDLAKIEKKRQGEKNRRNAVEAARKKNRRKRK